MTSTTVLTERQQQVLDLLNEGKGAREIGAVLDITRNAVYQNINRLKDKGALAPNFVPEGGQSTSARALRRVVTPPGPTTTEPMDGQTNPLVVQLLHELTQTQQELAGIANRLAKYLS